MTYLVGKIALDINAGAPNNGRGEDNLAKVKSMRVGNNTYPYVSAQAFRRWLRDSLPASESRSPVTRSGSGKNQQAYTAGRPDLHLDDDLFGYMVAVKKENFQRDTVLATGTFVAVSPQIPTSDFGTMTRGFASGENPVIHEHEHYTADVAGDVLLDLARVGTFETEGGGFRQALTPAVVGEIDGSTAERFELRGTGCLRMPLAERRRRVAVLLRSLASMRGGAKKSLHYGDRTPAMVVLAPMKGGVNPFTRILASRARETVFDSTVMAEEISGWRDELDGPVRIGWAPGFLGEQRDKAKIDLSELLNSGLLVIEHPRTMLTNLADAIDTGQHDGWFDDPRD